MHALAQQFGTVLRRLREAKGQSQEGLAEQAGVHRNYVGLLERGQRMPSILVVKQLAEALGTSMSAVLAEVEGSGEAGGGTTRPRRSGPTEGREGRK